MIPSDYLAPGRLWLLLVVLGLGLAYLASLRWRRGAQVRFTRVDLIDRVAPKRPGWRRHVIAGVQLLGLAVAVIGVARPVERTTERTESEGRILVLFDVSLSMEATDVPPNRLESAKVAALDFVERVDDDIEIGLISFAGAVNVEVNPTLDRRAVNRRIERLDLDLSTAIGDALAVATNVLLDERRDDAEDRGEDPDDVTDDDLAPGAIVLLSDGETTVGRETEVGAQIAADAGIPVFTIAFGTADAVIEDPTNGDLVPVPVAPEPLRLVAETTGGQAFEAQTGTELVDAYDDIRDSLGDTLGDEIEIVDERTWRWVLGAFILLALAWALGLWWLRGLV
ncbi:MAG: VWA domain-containing protein [Actinomycetota bacterium]